jgi:hypothetical protein
MLNKHEINSLKENIEWAKLDVERGSVYHIKWAQKYIDDVQTLLDALYYDYIPELQARADDVLRKI